MPYTLLNEAAPLVTVGANKQIHWNPATNEMLGYPLSVQLFHDAGAGRLAIRGVNWDAPLQVLFDEDMTYAIDAEAELADAGLSFAEDWSAAPELVALGELPDPINPFDHNLKAVWIAIL